VDAKTFNLLYKALVRPRIEYANSVWHSYKKKDIETCEVVFGPAYMGHRIHVVRAVTQRAAAEYSWASWPERERERTKKIGVAFSSEFFLKPG